MPEPEVSVSAEERARAVWHIPDVLTEVIAVAPVVTVVTGRSGLLITVICIYCDERHRHHWSPGSDFLRMSHCRRGRRPYLIGSIPDVGLLAAGAALHKVAAQLRRTAWIQRFAPDDVAAVASAIRALTAAVSVTANRPDVTP